MANLFPMETFARYDIVPNPMALEQTFVQCYETAFKLDAELKAAKAAKAVPGAPVIRSPYDTAADKDTAAKLTARETVVEMLDKITDLIVDNPNLAFHFAAEVKTISQFVTGEVNYARRNAERNLPPAKRSDADAIKRADAIELVKVCRLWYAIPNLAKEQVVKDIVKFTDKGTLALPKVHEDKVATAVPTQGRYVPHYKASYSVNGETFPSGSDPMDVLREVFTGKDRVGKRLADLFDPFDKAGGTKALLAGKTVEWEVNGKTVTAVLPTDEDSDEDSESE